MEPDQQQCTLDLWSSSCPQCIPDIPVEYSSTCFPPYFAPSDLSSPTYGKTSSIHHKSFGLNIDMARRLLNSTDYMQLLPSPCSVHCPDTNARFVNYPTTPTPSLSRDPYSVIQEQFCNAPWRRAGDLEPMDPTTGRSVLHALLEELTSGNKGPTTKCRLCSRVFARADRAITHIRHKHLDHRPFRCGGACGTKGCPQRFHSQENLAPHVKPKMVVCPHCQHKCLRQNVKRHINKYHVKQLKIISHMTASTTDLT